MTFVSEKLYILRCFSGHSDSALVYDSELRAHVRRLLVELEAAEDHRRPGVVRELSDLYAGYGPSVWKCILELSYLLHTPSEAREMFSSLLDRLQHDIARTTGLAKELSNELGWYAHTPYEFTRELVHLTLARLSVSSIELKSLIRDPEANRRLRVFAAEAVITAKTQSSYESVLSLIAELSNDPSAETYSRITEPLLRRYCATGTGGLIRAVEVFEANQLGRHGAFLLAQFRTEFATWFLSNLPKPSVRWASVILQAWRQVDDTVGRDNLLSVLIDDWASDTAVARFVRRRIQEHLRENRHYLDSAGRHLQARVLAFAGPRPGVAGPDFESQVREEFRKYSPPYMDDREQFPRDRTTAIVLARVYTESNDSICDRISEVVRAQKGKHRFQNTFFSELAKLQRFSNLPVKRQLQLVQDPIFVTSVTTEELDRLLVAGRLAPEVAQAVKRLLVDLLRASGLTEVKPCLTQKS